eukprot:224970-Pyramimonas_sp.AAC.2
MFIHRTRAGVQLLGQVATKDEEAKEGGVKREELAKQLEELQRMLEEVKEKSGAGKSSGDGAQKSAFSEGDRVCGTNQRVPKGIKRGPDI